MNPGCSCDSCKKDTATFWPPYENIQPAERMYWTFLWHCARGYGWSEWYYQAEKLT
jgi:hypothetical protein